MKRLCAFLLLGTMAAGQGAVAMSMSAHSFTPKVLPVLVQVNSHGKVTHVSSAVELTPRYDRLLRQTLDKMITRPANDHGHPVASQFVINLALQATPRSDGNYDASFAYVSTSPVPAGSWFWVHIDGHRLALRSQDSQGMPHRFNRYSPPSHYHARPMAPNRVASPAQGASHNGPRPVPARSLNR
ncbi:hypothetical protein [Frateuria sp. STR12]|uniref:hypothetical protein n=1 Tax=Frateuria hangzhouensis TaxID=2995589 RepID=UPI002260AA9C|nr:hypothetical protein [Frateuria sp. STR12]MCX7514713.1 hypothetical protein [Frateuria sp. STR12]